MKICGASVAKRDGSHLRCLLPASHSGDCDPRINNPRALQTPELLRHAGAMLRDIAAQVAEELDRRALLLERVRVKMAIAGRRGYQLPAELGDVLEVALDNAGPESVPS